MLNIPKPFDLKQLVTILKYNNWRSLYKICIREALLGFSKKLQYYKHYSLQ